LKKRIVIFSLLVLVAGGVAAGALFVLKSTAPPPDRFRQIPLKPEVAAFSRERLPGLYTEMLRLESALELIDGELKRLDEIEADFPDQKNIVAAERSLWAKTARELQKTSSALEKQLQALYVGFLVNRENGLAAIASQQQRMVADLQAALAASGALAARRPPPEPRGVIARLKDRFLK
jgi:hypothetical protein